MRAEIARTPLQHMQGLMGRKHLSKDSGMLFDFGKKKPLSFWMQNTYIPLQIAFIDDNGRVGQIERMVPLSTRPIHSNSSYRYALEVNDGWFDENGIRVNSYLRMPPTPKFNVPRGESDNTAELPITPDQNVPMPTAPPGEQQQPIKPEQKIQSAIEDIIKAAKEHGLSIMIKYVTVDGLELPPKTIEPPFLFEDTADGEYHGLLKAWDVQKARWSSFHIKNISRVSDDKGNQIDNVQQVEQLAKGKPPTQEEEWKAKGKLTPTPEQLQHQEYQRLLEHKT